MCGTAKCSQSYEIIILSIVVWNDSLLMIIVCLMMWSLWHGLRWFDYFLLVVHVTSSGNSVDLLCIIIISTVAVSERCISVLVWLLMTGEIWSSFFWWSTGVPIKQHNSCLVPQQTTEGPASSQSNEDRNLSTTVTFKTHQSPTATVLLQTQPINVNAWWKPAVSGQNFVIHPHMTIAWDKRLISYQHV